MGRDEMRCDGDEMRRNGTERTERNGTERNAGDERPRNDGSTQRDASKQAGDPTIRPAEKETQKDKETEWDVHVGANLNAKQIAAG